MILITGGMGFIGLHTARRLLDAGEQVVLTQYRVRREPTFLREELGVRAFVEQLDVTRREEVLDVVRRYRIDGIVHLAVPGLGALTPEEEYRVNMYGLLNILEAARATGVRRVSVASSISVYAGLPGGPYREEALLPLPSGNPTEAFKKAWEVLGLHYGDRTGVEVVMLRLGGIFGPLYHSLASPISRICHAVARGREPDFTGARRIPYAEDEADYCYVKDCATGIQLVQMADRLSHRIYNISSGRGLTYREIVDAVREVEPNAHISLPPGRSPSAKPSPYLAIDRIREELGYEPAYDVRRGVADYIAWLRENDM